MDAPVPLTIEVESHDRGAEDDALSQAMLRVLERVAGASTGNGVRDLFLNDFGLTERRSLGACLV